MGRLPITRQDTIIVKIVLFETPRPECKYDRLTLQLGAQSRRGEDSLPSHAQALLPFAAGGFGSRAWDPSRTPNHVRAFDSRACGARHRPNHAQASSTYAACGAYNRAHCH